MFFALRGIVDGVLAGTGTLREESYGRLAATPERRDARAARGLAPDPTMLVITRSGDVHWDAPLFDAPSSASIVAGDAEVPVPRARAGGGRRARGHARGGVRGVPRAAACERILCEGGPTLNRGLIAAGLIDELFVTLDPSLSGGDGLRLIKGERFEPPVRAELAGVLRHGDEVFLRYALR